MTPTELRTRLSMVVPFATFSSAELDAVVSCVSIVRIPAGEVAHEPGSDAAGLDILISGTVLREDPALATLGTGMGEINAPGTLFSKSALLRPAHHRHRLAAVSDTVLARLPRDRFLARLNDADPMAQRLLDHLVVAISADVREVNEIVHRLLAE